MRAEVLQLMGSVSSVQSGQYAIHKGPGHLARWQASSGVTVYAVHPGAMARELGRAYEATIPAFLRTYVTTLTKVFQKTAEGGAHTSLHCAFAE